MAVIGEIKQVDSLPKTRSGKIMRRVLRAREIGEDEGDTSKPVSYTHLDVYKRQIHPFFLMKNGFSSQVWKR